MVSKLFTFPTTGIEVKVRKVSQQILADASQSLKAPKPPTQEVELDGKKIVEANYSHPEYLEAMEKHQRDQMQLTHRIIVQLGVDYKLTEDDERELERVLNFMQANGITPTGQSKLEQWVYYVAVVNSDDLSALIEEVLGLGQPTPKSD